MRFLETQFGDDAFLLEGVYKLLILGSLILFVCWDQAFL